jgi:DNA invertase Pin-like site-specific DNA recombinase
VQDFYRTKPLWDAKNITLHFANLQIDGTTAIGKLMLGMMILMAQWESDIKSERIREALAVAKSKGLFTTGRPQVGMVPKRIGNKKYIIPDEAKIAIIRLIIFWRNIKKMSYRDISDRLEEIMAKRENRSVMPRQDQKKNDREPLRYWHVLQVMRAYKRYTKHPHLLRPKS